MLLDLHKVSDIIQSGAGEGIINYKSMSEMQNDESFSFECHDLSQDEDLQSLFNVMEENEINNMQKQEPHLIPDVHFRSQDIERGYCSDQEALAPKIGTLRKKRQVINQKQTRKTRRRTKIYIEVLESKVNELQSEVERLKKLNKMNKEYIHRLIESEQINGYFVGRQQVIEHLEALNSCPQVDGHKIMEELASLRLRQGVFGKDRLQAVNYYFKEMVEMLLPEIQKYIIKTAVEESDFFDPSYLSNGIPSQDVEDWRKRMLEDIGREMKDKNAREYLLNNRAEIIKETDKFEQMLIEFGHSKCRLIEQAKRLEQLFDGAHKYMRPVEISKSLCYIDKYRFQKNITLEHTFQNVFREICDKPYKYDLNQPFFLLAKK